jgi:hypothetical protein
MSEPSFNINKLLAQAGLAAQAQASQQRMRMLDQINKAVARELGLKDGYKAAEYPGADLGKGKLLFKPGEKLVLHIRGTMMGRTESWVDGVETDFSFFIGRDVALIISDRDDTPVNRARFIVNFNGFIEELG